MSIVRRHAVISGRVQGVYFRHFTTLEAERLCLTGWVRNLADGSVEAEFQGDEEEVDRMVNWLHNGSPQSQVMQVLVSPCPCEDVEGGFRVRY